MYTHTYSMGCFVGIQMYYYAISFLLLKQPGTSLECLSPLEHYSEHVVTLSLAGLLSIDHFIEVVIAWYRMVVSHASPYPHAAVILRDCVIIAMKR